MADQGYPRGIHTAKLEAGGGAEHAQLLVVMRQHTARTREFAAAACRAVGSLYCKCAGVPQFKGDYTHRGPLQGNILHFGIAMADVIAAVEAEDVQQTASLSEVEGSDIQNLQKPGQRSS